MHKYILRGKEAVPVEDLLEWARSFEASKRRVAVSTVFLGLDHSWSGGPPILFETMTLGGPEGSGLDSGYQERCSTWPEAEMMHAEATAWVWRTAARRGTVWFALCEWLHIKRVAWALTLVRAQAQADAEFEQAYPEWR